MAVVMACAMVACGDDDDPNDPGNSVPDPEGTVLLSMRNESSGTTFLSEGNFSIYIDKGDNFDEWRANAEFVNLGKMKGLGNITKIPASGWASKVAVTPGCGYIARYSNKNEYIRMYVVDYITSAEITNGVIGANVKYQYPFIPEGTLILDFNESAIFNEVALKAEAGSSQVVKIKNYVPYTVTGIPDWLKVTNGEKEIVFTALSDNPATSSNFNERGSVIKVTDKTGFSIDIHVYQEPSVY